jgi:hypothetical protein
VPVLLVEIGQLEPVTTGHYCNNWVSPSDGMIILAFLHMVREAINCVNEFKGGSMILGYPSSVERDIGRLLIVFRRVARSLMYRGHIIR